MGGGGGREVELDWCMRDDHFTPAAHARGVMMMETEGRDCKITGGVTA